MKITSKTFSGASKVHDGTLASVVRSIHQRTAFALAIAEADLTADNSGGASGGATIAAVPVPVAFTSVGTDAFPTAGGEAALLTVRNACTTLIAHIDGVAAAIGVPALTDSSGGTDGAGTIAAITVATTAVVGATGAMDATRGIAEFEQVGAMLAKTIRQCNAIAAATGQTLLVDNSGLDGGVGTTIAAIDGDTGADSDDSALSCIEDTAGEAFLVAAANAVATIAAKMDAITGGTLGAPAHYAG
jgi:hypothetical protein